MTFEDTLLGSLVGSLVGVAGGFALAYWNIKHSRHENTKERVYSPLFDEVEVFLRALKQNDPPWTNNQWRRITEELHLSYLIEPSSLYESVVKFYEDTMSNLVRQVIGCRSVFGEAVKQELTKNLGSAVSDNANKNAIDEVAQGVGWNLFKGEVWVGDLPRYNQNFERLKQTSTQLPSESFKDYFELWLKKTKDDKVLSDYRRFRDQAVREAKALRKSLGKKLGKKLR